MTSVQLHAWMIPYTFVLSIPQQPPQMQQMPFGNQQPQVAPQAGMFPNQPPQQQWYPNQGHAPAQQYAYGQQLPPAQVSKTFEYED